MKNLIIFVLALIALSSVFSVKLNKVLKDEKVMSVSIPNEKVELKSETLTDDTTNAKSTFKSELSLEKSNKSLSTQSCGELSDVLAALEGTDGYKAVLEVMERNNCTIKK